MTKINLLGRSDDGFAASYSKTVPMASSQLGGGDGDRDSWAFARARHHLALAGDGGSDLLDASPFFGDGECNLPGQKHQTPNGFEPFSMPGGIIFRNPPPETPRPWPTQLAKEYAEHDNLRYSGASLTNGFLDWFQSRWGSPFSGSAPRPRSRDPSTFHQARLHSP
jgi:hypothetical protein